MTTQEVGAVFVEEGTSGRSSDPVRPGVPLQDTRDEKWSPVNLDVGEGVDTSETSSNRRTH